MEKSIINNNVYMYVNPVYKKEHPVMAIAFHKKKINGKYQGIVREIVKREGDVAIPGFIDKSVLYIVESADRLSWKQKAELKIKGIEKIVEECKRENMEFIGLEDPTIWTDNGLIHVYFTIAYKFKDKPWYAVYLGHAQGKTLQELTATKPILSPKLGIIGEISGYKEAAISPVLTNNRRINLVESGYFDKTSSESFSTIVAAQAKDMSKPWTPLKTVADPQKMIHEWLQGHLSPAYIFEPDFIRHKDMLVGIVNGRSPTIKTKEGKKIYGKFCVGLMLFNPETGDIPWISPEPLIDDPDARTITFASDFLQLDDEKGILYAHVDDSFIRAYEISAKSLNKFLIKHLKD